MTNTADIRSGKVYVRGKCYRSQSKNGPPYVTCLVLCPSTGLVADSWCQCPAGVAGACSHAMALLCTVSLLKKHGFDESPPELACTELPQRWRRPRQAAMRAASIQDIDWRKHREGGKETPTWSRLFDPRREDNREESMNSDVKSLAECLVRKGHQFAIVLQEGSKLPFSETKFGEALQGSPATYQQSRKPAQLEVWRSQNIEIVTEICDPGVPTRINLFEDAVAEYQLPPLLDKCQADILKEIVLTSEDARVLERNTRQQASSKGWLSARKLRLTASQFGHVLHRSQWTEKGLNNLTAQRDLSKVRAVAYGRKHEDVAAQCYEGVMRRLGHDVALSTAGIVVDPSCPWLGASPDRFVHDPTEAKPNGVLEIKCPYTLKDSEPSFAKNNIPYLTLDDQGHPKLKRNHSYYYQVLGKWH
ncbi:uncharacterized protein LOC135396011 [Ornithodoros turicata]|uniref:uncharacterized protein LOC135396011 n=1 Tax=Ornithodoros turicata TaxID=34597 RepID=UPI0031389ADE